MARFGQHSRDLDLVVSSVVSDIPTRNKHLVYSSVPIQTWSRREKISLTSGASKDFLFLLVIVVNLRTKARCCEPWILKVSHDSTIVLL